MITVGALDDGNTLDLSDDLVPDWSARGPTYDGLHKPDVVAPGRRLVSLHAPGSYLSNVLPERVIPLTNSNATYFRLSGTSMSAPVVSGVVALMLERNPNLRPDRVKFILTREAQAVSSISGDGKDAAGAGLVDAYAAVTSSSVAPAKKNYGWVTLNYLALTALGLGIASVYQALDLLGVCLFLIPLLMARHSFLLYMRSTEAVRHQNDELQAANRRLQVMSEVARALSSALEWEETRRVIVRAAVDLMGWSWCGLVCQDERGHWFIEEQRGIAHEILQHRIHHCRLRRARGASRSGRRHRHASHAAGSAGGDRRAHLRPRQSRPRPRIAYCRTLC